MVQLLKYGNTNTFYISNGHSGILVDTDWAGTLSAFFNAIKSRNINIDDIKFLIITHYHPDHMGLAGELAELGIKLVVIDIQRDFIHCSDRIFQREAHRIYKPIKDDEAMMISCRDSRDFLAEIGVAGEIIYTPGHSDDSISIILDEGIAIVGDLDPIDFVLAYNDNTILKNSWNKILAHDLKVVFYGHANERDVSELNSIEDLCQNVGRKF